MTITRKLDRIPSIPDPVRMERYPIRALVADKTAPRSYTWKCDVVLDQGQEGACVGHGCIHEAIAKPDVWNFADKGLKLPAGFHPDDQQMAFDLYEWCKRNDEFPGENYDGTSVVTGLKGLVMLGVIGEYRWASNLEDALLGISWHGPAILGTDWWTGMFEPDRKGFIHMTGKIEGGHCILINGVDLKRQAIRLHNSWGPGWGKNGECFLSFADFGALIQAGAEVAIPVVRIAEKVSTNA
jgi:hypothetical protein